MRSEVRKQQHGRRDDWTWTTEVPCCRGKKKKKTCEVCQVNEKLWQSHSITSDLFHKSLGANHLPVWHSRRNRYRPPVSMRWYDQLYGTTPPPPQINHQNNYFSNACVVNNSINWCVRHTPSASSRVCRENGYFKSKHDLFQTLTESFCGKNPTRAQPK